MRYRIVISCLFDVLLVGLLHSLMVEGMHRVFEVPGDGSLGGACLWFWRVTSGGGDRGYRRGVA